VGLSYYRSEFSGDEIARFEQRIEDLVDDPEGNATVDVGSIEWADLTGDLDLQYVFPQGRSITTYLGLGLSIHLRNGSGAAIRGTFLEDALDDVAAGLNGTIGAEFAVAPKWALTVEARGVLLSDHRTASLRVGMSYRFADARTP
jgi:opacity protein-like surface antigen